MDTAEARAGRVAHRIVPSVSVIVCAYADRRWRRLEEAIASLLRQTVPPHEVVLVIDGNPGLLERAREAFAGATVVPNE